MSLCLKAVKFGKNRYESEKIHLWTNIILLWVSDDSWTEGMKAWLCEMNGRFCCQFSKTDFKTSHLLKDTSFFLMEGGIPCTWLLFWLCARWGAGTKKLLLWSTLCALAKQIRLNVCLNSVGDASAAVPCFTLELGPSYPCNTSLFRGCQPLTGEEDLLLGLWSVFRGCSDSLLWQSWRLSVEMFHHCGTMEVLGHVNTPGTYSGS